MRGEEPRTRGRQPHQCRRLPARQPFFRDSPGPEGRQNAPLQPRGPRWTLVRTAPQDRHPRLARVRRDRLRASAAWSAPRPSPPRTRATAVARRRPGRADCVPEGGRRVRPRAGQGRRRGHRPGVPRRGRRHRNAARGGPARPRRRVPVRQGQRGPDLRGRALRARELQGRRRRRRRRSASTPRWPPPPPPRSAHPELRIEQFGDASAAKALNGRVREGLPAGGDPLAADHAADPDRRLRRAASPPACRCCSASPP